MFSDRFHVSYLCGIEPGEPDLQSGVDVGQEGHVNVTLPLHAGQQRLHGDEECGGISILVVLNNELRRDLEDNTYHSIPVNRGF